MSGSDVNLPEVRRVAVGSTNPVKVQAVARVVRTFWPEAAVEGVEVPSGVPAQPWGEAVTIAGARQRAVAARAALDADLGLGLEGGVVEIPEAGGLFLNGWAAVATRSGAVYFGAAGRAPLPPLLVEALKRGEELGPAMDRLSGRENVKQTLGSVGVLTRGVVDRESQFAMAVAYALVPLLWPAWWAAPFPP